MIKLTVGMVLIQMLLGGATALFKLNLFYHSLWGLLTFVVFMPTLTIMSKDYGTDARVFKVGVAAVLDYVLQAVLGEGSFSSSVLGAAHLVNAFVLAGLVLYMFRLSDSATGMKPTPTGTRAPGTGPGQKMPAEP